MLGLKYEGSCTTIIFRDATTVDYCHGTPTDMHRRIKVDIEIRSSSGIKKYQTIKTTIDNFIGACLDGTD